MRRAFTSQAEFNAWHENAKQAAGLPIVGQNARTGQPQPDKQQTTEYTRLDGEMRAEVGDERLVARGLVDGLIRADLLTADELLGLVNAYPAWSADDSFEVGDLRASGGLLYECVQAHDGQADWSPPNVPALWTLAPPHNVIPEWTQPTGAHDAYNTGDRVTFNGSVYESTIDGNVWSPTDYPQGWTLIE